MDHTYLDARSFREAVESAAAIGSSPVVSVSLSQRTGRTSVTLPHPS